MMKNAKIAAGLLLASIGAASAKAEWQYGMHFPNGQNAVEFMYSEAGNFKTVNGVEYPFNYYNSTEYNNICDTSSVSDDRNSLIAYSFGPRRTSTPDKDCHLMFDINGDGAIDAGQVGQAFIEHNGVNSTGSKAGQEFNQFWFDDNWLARYMAMAYAKPHPVGLWAPTDYNRWALVGGDSSNWILNRLPYGVDFFDHITFRGMYNLQRYGCSTSGASAYGEWSAWILKSGAYYNTSDQRFDYPNVTEDYYYGFFLILTQKMLESRACGTARDNALLQHAISLRSHILSRQISNAAGDRLGWVTSRSNPNTLINTETTSLNVLGLGAGGRYAFEAGKEPMIQGPGGYFARPHNVLSAVKGLSTPGMLNYGPYRNFPTGAMTVEFMLRAPAAQGNVANLDIYDAASGQVLASRIVSAPQFNGSRNWIKVPLTVYNFNPANNLEFRVYWHGTSNLDVAYIQVK